jgi:hypothetical protein
MRLGSRNVMVPRPRVICRVQGVPLVHHMVATTLFHDNGISRLHADEFPLLTWTTLIGALTTLSMASGMSRSHDRA